jgi:transporter family protein
MTTSTSWFYWALLSAVFAAMTAIFAKIGIQGVDSDLATLVRTAIIMVVLSGLCMVCRKVEQSIRTFLQDLAVPGTVRPGEGRLMGVLLPRAPAGGGIQGGSSGQAEPGAVGVFAFVFLGERPSLREWSGIAMVAGGVLLLAFKR